jgi:hypothetical protein
LKFNAWLVAVTAAAATAVKGYKIFHTATLTLNDDTKVDGLFKGYNPDVEEGEFYISESDAIKFPEVNYKTPHTPYITFKKFCKSDVKQVDIKTNPGVLDYNPDLPERVTYSPKCGA